MRAWYLCAAALSLLLMILTMTQWAWVPGSQMGWAFVTGVFTYLTAHALLMAVRSRR